MLLGRRPRSRLDLLKPHTAERVEKRQMAQKSQHDQHARDRVFTERDPVFVRNYHQGDRWLPGIVTEKTGPVSFKVKLTTGHNRRCHQDQRRKRSVEVPNPETPELHDTDDIPTPSVESSTPNAGTEAVSQPPPASGDEVNTDAPPVVEYKTYPSRERKTVDGYEPKW